MCIRDSTGERELHRTFLRQDVQVGVEPLRFDLGRIARTKCHGDRRAQALALLITIGRVAILRREVVLRHRRAVVTIGKPPATAVLTAEHVRLELLPVVGSSATTAPTAELTY